MITSNTAKSMLAIGLFSALLGAQWVNAQPAHERDRDRHPPQHQQHKPQKNDGKQQAHKPQQQHKPQHQGKPPAHQAKPPAHKPPQQHAPVQRPPQHAKPPVHRPPQHAKPLQHRPPAPPKYQPLPRDFREVRNQAYRNRHHIGRGPLPPRGYQVVRGKRLFGDIGQPLTWQQQQYLPYYRGHEWRRLGGDLLLVDSSSGVVIELFKNVL